MANDLAQRLLTWFDQHGRHDLPWQHPRSAYRVWVSEIMLQQTQVQTVIPYFQRFMAQFPNVSSLAQAPADAVLTQWAGLGYYARARNLHRAAGQVIRQHAGQLPRTRLELEGLPGIGRSTAAAILALAYDQREAILDGNVRRVLARHTGIEGWPGQSTVQASLWRVAEDRLPTQRLADYTQALMDLGATVCRARQPQCGQCPWSADCYAYQEGRVAELPTPRPAKSLPLRTRWAAVLRDAEGRILLQRRPAPGIWGGLYSLPEAETAAALDALIHRYAPELAADKSTVSESAPAQLGRIEHVFSHYRLHLQLWHGNLPGIAQGIMEDDSILWYKLGSNEQIALPAPIARYLERLTTAAGIA